MKRILFLLKKKKFQNDLFNSKSQKYEFDRLSESKLQQSLTESHAPIY